MTIFLLVTVFEVDNSTVEMSCLMVVVNEDCVENITTGDFSVLFQKEFKSCQVQSNFSSSMVQLTSRSTCLPFDGDVSDGWCYRVSLMYQGTVIGTQTNIDFATCLVSELESFLGVDVTYELDRLVNEDGAVHHSTMATISCSGTFLELLGASQAVCVNGEWSDTETRLCFQMSRGNLYTLSQVLTSLIISPSICCVQLIAPPMTTNSYWICYTVLTHI